MQTHEVPDRPWSRVAADLFTLHGKEYAVLVDYYSDFIEVGELPDTTSTAAVQFLKEQFSRHGIPDCLITDNGSQLTSRKFKKFISEWEVNHVTSSPYHPRSNSKVESTVKIAKGLFKKALRSGQDPWLALLDHRNTPVEGLESSPTQRLMSRRTRMQVPRATSLLYPRVISGVEEKIKRKRQKAKAYYDRTAKTLPDLQVGQEVKAAPLHKSQTWKTATCVQQLSDRSYLVQMDKEMLRRNREAVKPVPQRSEVADKPHAATQRQVATASPATAMMTDVPRVNTITNFELAHTVTARGSCRGARSLYCCTQWRNSGFGTNTCTRWARNYSWSIIRNSNDMWSNSELKLRVVSVAVSGLFSWLFIAHHPLQYFPLLLFLEYNWKLFSSKGCNNVWNREGQNF